ncbi:MAG: helix-turn-helix transcriptional regulator [Chitinophaga sp.]|uniref:winged helix-turn-helix transcriptional regulator n=1 Tax=Chitinophaga sp. TaxID=1869181 RepID=UPI0025C604F4|nr:helix-turn-helix domain-containing protein [Chitinophaga sp.]MBV8253091.1 helix-turn-helix transcriptional regulator [Chitinophaga sp.]
MTAIKESSTIQENKQLAFARCPLTFVMEKIGGYWKANILYKLLTGPKRYSEIKRALPGISEKVLLQQLRQLEADQLIIREAKPVVPLVVTYSLSVSGEGLRPVLYAMAEWALGPGGYNEAYQENTRDMKNFPL